MTKYYLWLCFNFKYFFVVSNKQRASTKNLPCLFAELVEKYSEVGLKSCETKKSQRWRHANTQGAAKRLAFYHNYFPELSGLHSSLDSYLLCERPYNQIIVTDTDQLSGSGQDNKDSDSVLMKTMHPFLLVTLTQSQSLRVRRLMEYSQRESQQKSQSIADLTQQLEGQKTKYKNYKSDYRRHTMKWSVFAVCMKSNKK